MKSNNFVRALLLAVIAVAISFFAACEDDVTNTYVLPDANQGETFEITMPAGDQYTWSYASARPNDGIEYVTRVYVPDYDEYGEAKPGGGTLVFTFKALKAGSYEIRFEYSLAWSSEPPIEVSVYKIKVV